MPRRSTRIGELLLRQKNEKSTDWKDRLWLLSGILKRSHNELFLSSSELLAGAVLKRYEQALQKRKRGEPLQYILGEGDFWGRSFLVDKRVLIPRPETERPVEIALEQIKGESVRILDLGTGSGAIAVTLKLERPDWRCSASDVSKSALQVAAKNAERLGAEIELHCENIFGRKLSPGKFDWIISNPPYLEFARDFIAKDVRKHEPRMALEPLSENRLRDVSERAAWIAEGILRACAENERRPLGVLMELSPRVAYYLERKWRRHKSVSSVERHADLAGRRRFLLLRWK